MVTLAPADLERALADLQSTGLKIRSQAIYSLRFAAGYTAAQRERVVRGLVALLGHRTPTTRREAASALADLPDPLAVEPLIGLLGDKVEDVRRYAAQTLGVIGDRRAVEPLIGRLGDASTLRTVAQALGAIGDSRAIEPLRRVEPLVAVVRAIEHCEAVIGVPPWDAAAHRERLARL